MGYQDHEKLEIIVRKLLDEKFDGSVKKKTRLTFGMPGFVRKSPLAGAGTRRMAIASLDHVVFTRWANVRGLGRLGPPRRGATV
ncbi:MAG TPA: hypothetical protein PK867_12015 [Pirellulales bacterium]|nr:hypothetical protein [Pirellulales bacterium]